LQVALELFPSCYNCALRSAVFFTASYDVGGRGCAPPRVEEKEEEVVMTTGPDMMVRYFSLA
jgi:hypothetical protein